MAAVSAEADAIKAETAAINALYLAYIENLRSQADSDRAADEGH